MRRASVTMLPEQDPFQQFGQHLASVCTLLDEQNTLLARMLAFQEAQALRPDVDLDITVTTNPLVLSRNNRRTTRMWLANGAMVLIDNIHGGFAPFVLQAGWNYLDLVEGARIMVQSGPVFTALYQCTDVAMTGATL